MNSTSIKLILACIHNCIVLALAFALIYLGCTGKACCCCNCFLNISGAVLGIYAMALPVWFLTYCLPKASKDSEKPSASNVPPLTEDKVKQIVSEATAASNDEHINEIRKVYKDCFEYLTRENTSNKIINTIKTI